MTDRGPRLRWARLRRDGVRLPSSLRRLTVGIVAAGALLAGAAPAQAAVTSAVRSGELTARSDAGDGIAIWCAADARVRVNGAQPGTGPAACSSIRSISVYGGPASNGIDLSLVSRTRFSGLIVGGVNGIRGGGGDDRILGSAIADSIAGEEGNDYLDGDSGGDRLDGGVGDDRLLGFDGRDGLFGGEGSDRLEAEAGTDHLEGDGGNDRLLGGDDDDMLLGGDGDDSSLNGNGGGDKIGGGDGADHLFGEADRDELAGGTGDDNLTGDLAFSPEELKGNDVLDGGEGTQDRVFEQGGQGLTLGDGTLAGLGNDTLTGVETATLGGGSSPDTIDASRFSGPVTLLGRNGADTLIGGPANDIVGSAETSYSEKGDDTLTGGGGDDTFHGGEHADRVKESGDVNFTLTGITAEGTGTLDGLGDDKLNGVETVDLTGGAGANTLDASAFSGKAVLDGAAGNDELRGGTAADRLTGGADDDTLTGNTGVDVVDESGDVNFVLSNTQLVGRGTDVLDGVEAADLTGGTGANTLDASAFSGKAVLDGAAGNDELRGGTGADRLTGGADDDTLAGNGQGNGEVDVVDESGDVDFTLSNTQLVGRGTDGLNGIEEAALTGGAGGNTLDASAFSGTAVLDGAAGGDRLTGGTGGDQLSGGDGGDVVLGSSGEDTATGGPGDDALVGGPDRDILGGPATVDGKPNAENAGVDAFWGEEGNDYLRASDEIAESIACGAGYDGVDADRGDRASADCEDVIRSGGAAPRAPRSVTLRASSGRVQSGGKVALMGRIRSAADPAGCQPNQQVALQRARPGTGRFGTFARVRTNSRGAYGVAMRVTATYVYRAKVPATARCLGALSNKQRVTVGG